MLLLLAVALFATGVLSLLPAVADGVPPSPEQTVRYEGLALTVPTSWKVTRGGPFGVNIVNPTPTCIGSSSPVSRCRNSLDTVIILSLRLLPRNKPSRTTVKGRFMRVNGLTVFVARTRAEGTFYWRIPALDLSVNGGGPQVPAVLRTLRRA